MQLKVVFLVHYFIWEDNIIIVFSIFFCDYLGKRLFNRLAFNIYFLGRHQVFFTSFSIKLRSTYLKRILVVNMLPFTPFHCSVLFSSFFSFLCFLITSVEIKTLPILGKSLLTELYLQPRLNFSGSLTKMVWSGFIYIICFYNTKGPRTSCFIE